MQTGNADVIQTIDGIAHHLGRDSRFLCHWYVRSSRRGDQDYPGGGLAVDATFDNSGAFMKDGRRYDFGYRFVSVSVGPRDEQAVATLDDRARDGGDLCRCLALAEDDFRKALTPGAVVIDLCEAEVFERTASDGERALFSLGRIEAAFAHRFEQRPKRGQGCRGFAFAIGQGRAVDSAGGPPLILEWGVVPRLRTPIL